MNKLVIQLHKNFEKQLAKLSKKRRDKAIDTIELFLKDPNEPSLRNHALTAEWVGYRSISAGGDLRLHFKVINDTTVLFVAVGSRSQLYT